MLPFLLGPRSDLDLHVTDPRTPAAIMAEDFFRQLMPANEVQYVWYDFMLVR